MPNNHFVLFFWQENDVTVLKTNFHFSVMAQKVPDSERTCSDRAKQENYRESSICP